VSSCADHLPCSPPAFISQCLVFMPKKKGMRGGAVIPSCFRVSAHLGHGLWACPLGQVRWHSSEYKSILNSDSSIASSGSQNCPLFRACSLARASVLLIATSTVKGQLLKLTLRNSYTTGGFRCRKVQLVAGNFEGKSISNDSKHPS
jgi:hypothetical protein